MKRCRRGLSWGLFSAPLKLQKGVRRRNQPAAGRVGLRSFEHLEPRWALSANPVLIAGADQTVDENVLVNVGNSFTDVAQMEGVFSGLNPFDFVSLGNFDPEEDPFEDVSNPMSDRIPRVVIDTSGTTPSLLF
ncbi:MAG TPA: hypothetical protein VF175_13950, partial [Lacipirellula sp.]